MKPSGLTAKVQAERWAWLATQFTEAYPLQSRTRPANLRVPRRKSEEASSPPVIESGVGLLEMESHTRAINTTGRLTLQGDVVPSPPSGAVGNARPADPRLAAPRRGLHSAAAPRLKGIARGSLRCSVNHHEGGIRVTGGLCALEGDWGSRGPIPRRSFLSATLRTRGFLIKWWFAAQSGAVILLDSDCPGDS